jgi:CelD/BcsL family acetyltransferase involved in cellulose biosynthesis
MHETSIVHVDPPTCRTVHVFRPLEDSRWDEFVQRHPRSSAFHTRGWLEALRRTYGFTPLALTTSPPESPLENGWLFCSIDSWLTGRRWVSLPFSDHCQPLNADVACEEQFLAAFKEILVRERLRYIEVRPLQPPASPSLPPTLLSSKRTYCFHHVDLTPELQILFRNSHKDSTQRKIQRADRERLRYEEGRSPALIDVFYGLQLLTRRRHGLPPQPKEWFRNVAACVGEAAHFRVAYKDKQPLAAILTIRHKNTVMYKYGCSDAVYHNLGGMHFLLWKTIEDAKREGLRTLDLGRSDPWSEGLITFKDRWGSQRSVLCYSRYTSAQSPRGVYADPDRNRKNQLFLNLFTHRPHSLSRMVGELFYRHLG